MRRHLVLYGSIINALSLPFTLGAQRGSISDTTTRVVDRVFDAYSGTSSPGCALGVSRNGRVVYERGYGMANLETGTPITPASIFHVASVSKQFTAMSIMLLARDGRLSVDDDIRKYLPEIPSYGTTITIRHLLTHTSGLRDQWNLIALARGRFEEDRITEADVVLARIAASLMDEDRITEVRKRAEEITRVTAADGGHLATTYDSRRIHGTRRTA